MNASHRRHDISDRTCGIAGTAFAWTRRRLGRHRQRQSVVHQRDMLDFANGRSMAGFAAGLGRLEERAAAVLPLARQRRMGSDCWMF